MVWIRLYYKRSAVVGAFRGGPFKSERDVVYSGMVFTLAKPARDYIQVLSPVGAAALCGAVDTAGSVSPAKI